MCYLRLINALDRKFAFGKTKFVLLVLKSERLTYYETIIKLNIRTLSVFVRRCIRYFQAIYEYVKYYNLKMLISRLNNKISDKSYVQTHIILFTFMF